MKIYFSPDVNRELLDVLGSYYSHSIEEISQHTPGDLNGKILILSHAFFIREGIENLKNVLGVCLLLESEKDLETVTLPENILLEYSVGGLHPAKLQNLFHAADVKEELRKLREERDAHLRRLKDLNKIGIALSTERDSVKLLNMILRKSREITSADAGSLYLVEGEEEPKQLRFKISQNDSIPVDYEEFVMPITKNSVAGYAAATGEHINIPDVYQIPPDQEYHFNRQLDQRSGYRSISMLTIPMKNHRGEIIGVIQLINRKKDPEARLNKNMYRDLVEPFDQNDEDLVNSLASQAAVALENSTLIKSIQNLFEGFVTAAVTAIESRDPTTSGHSFRVANLTVGLATLVDGQSNGKFREISFDPDEIKEMRYAALLHDFGKVGVRENVLVKAKKLYPLQTDLIRLRFQFMKKAWEAEFHKSQAQLLSTVGKQGFAEQQLEMEAAYRNRLQSLDDYLEFITQSNEPSVLAAGSFERLLGIAGRDDLIPPGENGPLLTSEEVRLLSIRKGNLNDRERLEIESHVTHTFLFLSKIPWTSELKHVPRFAFGHHEKLDGSGYPNRLKAEEIPIQTRIMTISDIYDALTASDRPYKRAVPTEKALDIIAFEVKNQQLDAELFELFLEAKVYQLATGNK